MCDRSLPRSTQACNCPGFSERPSDLTLGVHTSRRWGEPIPYGFLIHALPTKRTRWRRSLCRNGWSLPGGPCPSRTSILAWITSCMAEDGWKPTRDPPYYWLTRDSLWGFKIFFISILYDEWRPREPMALADVPVQGHTPASHELAIRYPDMTRPLGVIPRREQTHAPYRGVRVGEAAHPGPRKPDECQICTMPTGDDPFWCTHTVCKPCLRKWRRHDPDQILHCPACRRSGDFEDLLLHDAADLRELPKLAWAMAFSHRAGQMRLDFDFPPDTWVQTPLPGAPETYLDDRPIDWTWLRSL